MIKISVPATTTNFGSGFDSLGMAVSIYNEFYIERSESLQIIIEEQYRGLIPEDENNLIYQSAKSVFEELRLPVPGMKITQSTNIPMSRGLGSSASCIIAGLLAANEISGAGLSRQKLLDLAVAIEGHPDNVLPALIGGFTIAMMEGATTRYLRYDMDSKFIFYFLIPPFELSTSKARSVLPESYSRKDTVTSISRALFLAASLMQGNAAGLQYACDDVIHQCYRSTLIENYDSVVKAAYKSGADGVFLSGAGPSIAAITSNPTGFEKDIRLPDGWRIVKTDPDYSGAVVEHL